MINSREMETQGGNKISTLILELGTMPDFFTAKESLNLPLKIDTSPIRHQDVLGNPQHITREMSGVFHIFIWITVLAPLVLNLISHYQNF